MKANELKATDIMVGDWVHLINTSHNVSFPENGVIQDEGYTTIRTPIKITTVSENCVSYYSNKLKSYITLSIEEIEPIPLTPDILEKNGFERENLITSYNHYTGIDNRVSLNDDFYCMNSRNKWNVYIDSEDYCTIANCELTYLHELQHLLTLCKIDFDWKV